MLIHKLETGPTLLSPKSTSLHWWVTPAVLSPGGLNASQASIRCFSLLLRVLESTAEGFKPRLAKQILGYANDSAPVFFIYPRLNYRQSEA